MALSDIAVQVSRGSVSLLAEAWTGIDVDHTTANVSGAKWVMHLSLNKLSFYSSPVGGDLVGYDNELTAQLMRALGSLSLQLPVISRTLKSLHAASSYREVSFRAVLLNRYYAQVQVLSVNISYLLHWANPVWGLLDYDPSSELPEVQKRLRSTIAATLDTGWVFNSSDSSVEAVPVYQASYLMEWWFYLSRLRHLHISQ